MIGGIPEDMRRDPETPSAQHLFGIAGDVTKLSSTDADLFVTLWRS